MFYSASTGGFYNRAVHGSNMPDDVVEISKELYLDLLNGQTEGQIITADENGIPVLSEPPAPTPEQTQSRLNDTSRKYLAETDWYVIRYLETGEPVPQNISAERALARSSIVE